jgi:hypothetical protein
MTHVVRCSRKVYCKNCGSGINKNIPHFAVFGSRFAYRLCVGCLKRELDTLQEAYEVQFGVTGTPEVITEVNASDLRGF